MMEPVLTAVTCRSSPEEKIALFGSLFRGRDDVYPRRFESAASGRAGYQPACANEWVRGVCEKAKTRCALCGQRKFVPVTKETVRWHLSGADDKGRPFVMGVYPLLADEHCHFVAADFDKATWRDDVGAVVRTCGDLKLPVAVERSRSGKGAHLWWFFSEPLPGRLAREFAAWILTETLERRPEVGLDSYDRLFPNQDTVPKGGFGNLIALPLQKQARASGNSVFVDERGEPFGDQWAFLSGLQKLCGDEVETCVESARRNRRIVAAVSVSEEDEHAGRPWEARPSRPAVERPLAQPLPEQVDVVLADQLYLRKADLTPGLKGRLIRLAAFQNPDFYKAQSMRLSTFGKPRVICCAEDTPDFLVVPRGCLDALVALLQENGIRSVIQDERFRGTPLEARFQGELRPEQERAAKAMLAHDTGVLAAGTAFGKTVLAAWLIAERGVNTLVLVNRQQLQTQWVARLSTFLDVPEKEIGRIGGGHRKITGKLDVALIQSLVRKGQADDGVAAYGHVVVDECHALSAPTFERVVRCAKARYVTGLSATPVRKDGHQPIIYMQCGPVRHRVNAKQLSQTEPFAHIVQVRPTAFHASLGAVGEEAVQSYQTVCDELVADEARNRLIVADVLRAVSEGRSPVVLTERREHVQRLADALHGKVMHVLVLKGGLGKKQLAALQAQLSSIPDSEPRVLLATGRYLGEGFDDARLDTLFLVMPISWRGRIAQYAGRLHRRHGGKREVRILDYVDLNVSMLARMFDRRCRGYEAIGYRLVMPLSATPGWPTEVAVPVEPAWQETYAASVRRLCRDGLDAGLADLFVFATWKAVSPDTTGAERARSATEAFLYRRLETLETTRGSFQLNAQLPIPFCGNGTMEADLVCQSLRLAIELDGAQHFADLTAYRRDRRKDALLQENGYMVIRFLAEDVCEQLNEVLDSILRAVVHQKARHSRDIREGNNDGLQAQFDSVYSPHH
jgi:superfamily II DNA or RNA helicase/very-short-patch-repair endonuclease